MFNSTINKVIMETNLVIKHALKDKIFLACSVFAVVVVLFSLLCKLNKLEWVGILLTISISMTRALEYSYAHKSGKDNRKLIIGSELLFQTIIAMIIGVIIFYDKTIQDPNYIIHRISGNENLIFAICLITATTITVFAKIIWNSGEPLHGGIISGHSAFVASLFIINTHANLPSLILILPAIAILIPRCIQIKKSLKILMKIIGGFCMLYLCIITINREEGIVLIVANITMLALVIMCQGKPVHCKKEMLNGLAIGFICSALIIYNLK